MSNNSNANHTKKALKNTFFQLLAELVTEISGFILPRYMLLTFGSALTGLVSSVNQMIKYLKKMEAGLSTASSVNLYAPLAKKDYEKASEVVSTSKAFYAKIGVYFSIGALLLAFIYPFVVEVGVDAFPWYKVTCLVLILAGSGAISYFISSSYQALLIADQRYYIVSIINSVGGIITIPVILLLLFTDNMLVVQMGNLIITGFQSVAIALCARIIYKGKIKSVKTRDMGVLSMRWDVFVNEIGMLVETNAPVLIITFVMGVSSVAVYTIYNMVFQALQSVIRISRDTLRPSFGQVWASGDKERTKNAYNQYEWVIYTMTFVLYTVAGILILPFVKLYTRNITDIEYIIPAFAMFFCLSGAIRQLQVPASVMVGAAGKFKEVRGNIIVSAIACLVLGIPGCYFFGLPGVMLAMVFATMIRSGYTTYYINKKVLGRSVRSVCMRLVRMSLATAIAVIPFVTVITIAPTSLYVWLVWAVGVTLWTALVHFVFALLFENKVMTQTASRLISAIRFKVKK